MNLTLKQIYEQMAEFQELKIPSNPDYAKYLREAGRLWEKKFKQMEEDIKTFRKNAL